jgi:Cysteine-rich secretory protein family
VPTPALIPPTRRRRGSRQAHARGLGAAIAVVAVTLGMLAWAGSALGGAPIRSLASCPNAYVIMGPSAAAEKQFQATMLCLINAVRKAEKLPPLKLAKPLDEVATAQSNKFARTGSGSHGSSITDIAKRFVAKGYHPAAYDEGFDDLPTGATPYWFVSHILSKRGLPCTQVLDPRFRDFGVASTGVVNQASPLPFIFTLAMEFGLRAGQHQPSSNTHAAGTCPHQIPAPVVTGLPVKFASTPAPSGGTVGIALKCEAKVPCTLTATMTLPDAKASATTPSPVSIPAHKSLTISFTFTPAQVQQELKSKIPIATVVEHNTAPVAYDNKISELLPAPTN